VTEPGSRLPLPTDPALCPPLDASFAAALDTALSTLDIELTLGQRAGIESHVRLLLAWNAAINLTAIRRPAAIALEHVADALTALTLIRAADLGARPAVLDLGSGAGYPGLPLGLVLPAGRFTLVDSVGKKARFLDVAGRAAIQALAAAGETVPELMVAAERAEALARSGRHRGRHDLVTVRAVGSLDELVELGLPFLRPGGRLVAWKRAAGPADLDPELAEARRVLPGLGGVLDGIEVVRVPGLEDHRLVAVRSVRPTPPGYPRAPAERRRHRR
jgi:16S rRNA (guanine527-N7)-methyltransferase